MDCLKQAFAQAFGFVDDRIPSRATMQDLVDVCYGYDVDLYWGNEEILLKDSPVILVSLTGDKYVIPEGEDVLGLVFDAHAMFCQGSSVMPYGLFIIAVIDVRGNSVETSKEYRQERKTTEVGCTEVGRHRPRAGGYL